MTANPWLRPEDVITTVAEWTGLKKDQLLVSSSGRGTRRVVRARVLLARCLQMGLECSKQDVAQMMGYSTHRGRLVSHLFKKDWDASEVAAVLNLAKDRRS